MIACPTVRDYALYDAKLKGADIVTLKRFSETLTAGVLVLAGLNPAAMAGVWKIGPEFRVNTTTEGYQHQPAVAALGSGGFVVVWTSFSNDIPSDVLGQRFAADGSPVGSEFLVNTFTDGTQGRPAVAALLGGGFVVVWSSSAQHGAYGQRFQDDGTPVGTEFRVNTAKPGGGSPAIAGLADGGFVVMWVGAHENDPEGDLWSEIYGKRYTADGAPVGEEFHVNTATAGAQSSPSVTGLANGGFVVMWHSQVQPHFHIRHVYGQRYRANGKRAGGEFPVPTKPDGREMSPSVAGLRNGDFVVAWAGTNPGRCIDIQRYRHDGTPAHGDTQVYCAPSPNDPQERAQEPSVAALPYNGGGLFAVVWVARDRRGRSLGVFGQRFRRTGTPAGGRFRVNSFGLHDQFDPSITALGDAGFVVVWRSDFQDGSNSGIYGQRFGAR